MIDRKTVDSYAVFWLLGIAFLWWPVLLLRSIADRRPATRRSVALLVTTVCLAASLVVAAAAGASPSRVLGAFANLSVWIVLWRTIARKPTVGEVDDIIRGVVDLAMLQGILVVGARIIYPWLAGTTLPLARALPSSITADPNVAAFSTVRLAIPDYFGHSVLRTSGIFGNPTWAGAFAAVAILLLLFARGSLSATMQRPIVRAALLALTGLTLYFSYARVDDLALVVAILAVIATKAKAFLHPGLWMASVCAVAAATVAAIPALPLATWFDQINRTRRGSLVSREDIYGPTLRAIARSPTPILGSGVKHRVLGLVASLGTHSTYLGLAYRGGILAAVAFALFIMCLGYRAFERNASLAFGLACFLALFCVTDDIDAGHLLPLLLIIIYGLVTISLSELPTDASPPGTNQSSLFNDAAAQLGRRR